MPNLKTTIRRNFELFATCIYIALAIAVTQVISSQVQKYFIDNPNPYSAVFMLTFIVVLYGFVIFVLVKISGTFRKFLLRMFGVESEKVEALKETKDTPKITTSNKPKIDKEREFQVEMLRLQLKYDNANLVMTVILSLIVSLLAVFVTIILSGVYGVFPENVTSIVNIIIGILIALTFVCIFFVGLVSRIAQKQDLDKLQKRFVETQTEIP